MSTLPKGVTQAELDRYAQLAKGIKALVDEKDQLSDKIKKAYHDAGVSGKRVFSYSSKKYGTIIVTLGVQMRLAKDAVTEAFPITTYPDYWSPQINVKAIPKEVLDIYREETQTLSVDVEQPLKLV